MKTGTQIWTYDTSLNANQQSWVGYDVRATDGDIGKVDEMTTEAGRGNIVVDTGFWIFGKKRLLPAGCVQSVDHTNKTVSVSLTKDQIKNAADYDAMRRDEDSYYDDYNRYYGDYL